MWNSTRFDYGITNGADWYVIYGGMQDWNYIWMGCNDVTIELSQEHWPDASMLPSLWEDNRESMLSYLEAVHWGIRGIITDAISNQPLDAAIEVVGINHKVFSDPDVGDYYRLLLPGMYTLRFSAEGYFSKEVDSVVVTEDYITYLNVELLSASYFSVAGTVSDQVTGKFLSAQLKFTGNNIFSIETDSTGFFQLTLPADKYVLHISSDRYATLIDTLTVTRNLNTNYQLLPYVYVLDLDFEPDNGNLIASDTLWQWGKPDYGSQQAYSGEKLWGTYLNGSYPDNVDAGLTLPTVILPDADNLVLSFRHWMEAEIDNVNQGFAFDGGIVEISLNNDSTWSQLYPQEDYPFQISEVIDSGPFAAGTPVFSGNHVWKEEMFDLTLFAGNAARFRFLFGSDKENEYPYAGWYLDDIAIKHTNFQSDIKKPDTHSSPKHFNIMQNYPNPFNNSTIITYQLSSTSRVNITVFNMMGQVVEVLADQKVEPGNYQVTWNGKDFMGRQVASGIYFIQMKWENQILIRKALLLR